MAPRSYTLIKELKKSPTDNDDNDDSERNNWKIKVLPIIPKGKRQDVVQASINR
ncbi:hypothetical protein KSS87_006238, partial [Heliosperma pusillum]